MTGEPLLVHGFESGTERSARPCGCLVISSGRRGAMVLPCSSHAATMILVMMPRARWEEAREVETALPGRFRGPVDTIQAGSSDVSALLVDLGTALEGALKALRVFAVRLAGAAPRAVAEFMEQLDRLQAVTAHPLYLAVKARARATADDDAAR